MSEKKLAPRRLLAEKHKCPWCGKSVLASEPNVRVDGQEMHLHCAAEEEDSVFFDRDMEFGG